MSARAATLSLRAPRPAAAPAASRERPVPAGALEVSAFCALLAVALQRWADLFLEHPTARTWALVGVGSALAAGLALSVRLGRWPGRVARLALLAGATFAAPRVIAFPTDLFAPAHWGDLRRGLGQGLVGLQSVHWPYRAGRDWITVALLLMAPLAAVVAPALAFWPTRRGASLRRGLALAAVLTLYGYTVVSRPPAAQGLIGLVLLALIGAWLWLPSVTRGRREPALAALLAVGVLAAPAAAVLAGGGGWLDYRSWRPFAGASTTNFDWEHAYGPITWSRTGIELLSIRSPRPLYWKLQTLDRFDGVAWQASAGRQRQRDLEVPPNAPTRWQTTYSVEVRALRSALMVGAGTPLALRPGTAGTATLGPDAVRFEDRPTDGTRYTVRAYDPEPTPAQLRAAPPATDPRLLHYTTVGQPGGPDVTFPLRAGTTSPADGLGPGYARVRDLAQRLAAGAPTAYDVVRRVELDLAQRAVYDERPPRRALPLVDFLFRDHRGYCQYFAGAMALELRMDGIPARVVGGFAPGAKTSDGFYRITDEDAHSWVEVYFTGIGWVTFDPTPPAGPASGQEADAATLSSPLSGAAGATFPTGSAKDPKTAPRQRERPGLSAGRSGRGQGGGGGLGAWLAGGAAALVALAGGGNLLRRRAARRRSRDPGEVALGELRAALAAAGRPVPAGTTLRALEGQLGRAAGPGAADYVRALAKQRYAPGAQPPGRSARARLRRALWRGAGPLRRLRVLAALPPRLG